jgi:DNA-binding GntR family transcriptional regulator
MCQIRAVIEGLACRQAAENNSERAARLGPALIDAGRKAVAGGRWRGGAVARWRGGAVARWRGGAVAKMITADIKFHEFLYAMSGSPLIAPALATQLGYTQRMMGEVLMRDEQPVDIWDQHAQILEAIVQRDAERAEALGRRHITPGLGLHGGAVAGRRRPCRPVAASY